LIKKSLKLGRVILELPKSALKVTVVSVAKKNGQIVYDKSTEHLIGYTYKFYLYYIKCGFKNRRKLY
jgi:hypothetical protein